MSDRFNIDGNDGLDQADDASNDKSKSMMHNFKANQFPFTHLMSSSAVAVTSNQRKLVRNKLILNGSLQSMQKSGSEKEKTIFGDVSDQTSI